MNPFGGRRRVLAFVAAIVVMLGLGSALAIWASARQGIALSLQEPGADGAPTRNSTLINKAPVASAPKTNFVLFAESGESLPLEADAEGEWGGFRGPERDNIARNSPALSDLSKGAPALLWSLKLGEGHAGAAISNGRVFLLDYIEEDKVDALRCFDLKKGTELWRRSYPVKMKRNHGFSRSIPAISQGRVLTFGPTGYAMCVDAATGDLLWIRSLFDEYGTKAPLWYSGQCPIIDGKEAIICPGGNTIMMGIDLETGKTLWETRAPEGLSISHSSIMLAENSAGPIYLYAALGGVVAISAEATTRGRLLWSYSGFNASVIAPSVIALSGGQYYLTAGYGAGSVLFEAKEAPSSDSGENADYKTSTIYIHTPDLGMASEQQTPILWKGLLFGVLPKDAGNYHDRFVCASPKGSILWCSDKTDRFGLGPYLLADGKFYVLSDDGTLTAIKASTSAYEKLGSVQLMKGAGVDAWAPMALSGSLLVLRDSTTLYCFDIGEEA